MQENNNKIPTVDTLLAVMSEQLKTLLESVRKIENKLEAKVDLVDFLRLEKVIEEIKKENDARHKETSDKVNSHAIKLGIGGALLTVGSWIVSVFKVS